MTAKDMTPFEGPVADFAEQLDFSSLMADDGLDLTAAIGQSAMTVSPQELFLDHDFTAPSTGSTAYLTTPSLIDGTPDLSSYDCSPAFGTLDTEQTWPPLFPDTQKDDLDFATHPLFSSTEDFELSHTTSLTSSASSLPPTNESAVLKRSRSSIGAAASPSAEPDRHCLSLTSGILKSSRRQCKDLAPIDPDENDERAVKRARNTMAARKSRQKKRDIEDALRLALEAMTAERDRWRMLAVKHGAPIPDE